MQVLSGKVVEGKIVVEAELPEGSDVTVLAREGNEPFEVAAELEAVLLESIAQGERGETISPENFSASFAAVNDSLATCPKHESWLRSSHSGLHGAAKHRQSKTPAPLA